MALVTKASRNALRKTIPCKSNGTSKPKSSNVHTFSFLKTISLTPLEQRPVIFFDILKWLSLNLFNTILMENLNPNSPNNCKKINKIRNTIAIFGFPKQKKIIKATKKRGEDNNKQSDSKSISFTKIKIQF